MNPLQLELPFDEVTEEQVKPEFPYYKDPKNDNERLMNYQHDWLTNKDKQAWQNLWGLTLKIAAKCVSKIARGRKIYLCHDDFEDKTHITAEYLLRRYTTRPGYFIKKNYIASIYDSAVHAVLYKTKAEKIVDFMDTESVRRRMQDENDSEELF